jgi:hypothetical protein
MCDGYNGRGSMMADEPKSFRSTFYFWSDPLPFLRKLFIFNAYVPILDLISFTTLDAAQYSNKDI